MNEKNFLLFIALAIFLDLSFLNYAKASNLLIKVEFPKRSGNFIEKDVIEFIEDVSKDISTISEYNKTVMVMGMSGTGKSTLVNYLNDIPLVCKKIGDKWILVLENENITLPGGFSIGHIHRSETFYPSVYSPKLKDFSYIDNPGFRETRGFVFQIANGFFIEKITRTTTDLKFLLLLTHADLNDRGINFRESIKGFSEFLGIFDEKDTNDLYKSIGIIVSRADNDGLSDNELLRILKFRLLEIVEEEFKNDEITFNQKQVFENIIKNDQVELFSNPKREQKLDNKQSLKIVNLIDRIEYIKKSEAKLRVKISNQNISKLFDYISNQYELIELNLRSNFVNNIEVYLNKTNLSSFNSSIFIKAYNVINQILNLENANLETCLNSIQTLDLNEKDIFIDLHEIDKLILKNNVLKFFIQILPENIQSKNIKEVKFITIKFKSYLENFKLKLIERLGEIIDNFNINIKSILTNQFDTYFQNKITLLNSTADLSKLEKEIEYFINQIKKLNSLEGFLKNAEKVVSSFHSNQLLEQGKDLERFIQLLPNYKKKHFSNYNQWSGDLIEKFYIYLNELKNFYLEYEPMYNSTDDSLTIKAHFGLISKILKKINKYDYGNNLKIINIYATHSITFDTNFKINQNRYRKNSPHLFLISPRILVKRNVTVDLSCYKEPDYPDNKKKAWDGLNSGKDGPDGKPGLAGFNAGNFILITSYLNNKDNLYYKLIGGKGGPGQNGGDGIKGDDGKSGSYVSIESWQEKETYKSLGEEGYDGGDGGRGGCGGKNGYGGTFLLLLHTRNKDNITVIGEIDSKEYISFGLGKNGEPGEPGIGGLQGDTVVNEDTYLRFISAEQKISDSIGSKSYNERSHNRALNGSIKSDLNCMHQNEPIENNIRSNQIDEKKKVYEYMLEELIVKFKTINLKKFLFFK